MVLVAHLSCQMKDVKQVAKIYSTFDCLPSYIKKTGPYFQVNKKEGIQALTIYRADEGTFDKAYTYLLQRLQPFSGVPSVSFSVERWESINDTLDILRGLGPAL